MVTVFPAQTADEVAEKDARTTRDGARGRCCGDASGARAKPRQREVLGRGIRICGFVW